MARDAGDLKRAYDQLTNDHTLVGSAEFYELAQIAKEIAKCSQGHQRALSFTLSSIFESLAQRQDGAAISSDEALRLYTNLNVPLSNAIDRLNLDIPATVLVATILQVLDSYFLDRG